YYRLRATDRNLRDPHSLAFRILAENGLTGVLLFLGWLGTTLAVVATRWRRLDRSVRRWIIALLAGAGTVLGQSLADWTWLLPGLHGLTFLSLGVAVAFTCDPPGLAARIERVTPPARRAIAVVGAVVAAVLLALPYLADVYERRARIATTPQAQIQDARSAAKLDPWRTVPHYLEAGALEALGQDQAARKELWRAVQLEPTDFVTLALIGDLEVRAGRRGVAQDWYRRASARNPKDIGLAELARGQFTSP
ncbi:MAG: hypothetical protein QOJ29_932, partial [Thermoleophilaceae bacterium]|nr:hypothetical protein [Thermoleophilaceae bacterium]